MINKHTELKEKLSAFSEVRINELYKKLKFVLFDKEADKNKKIDFLLSEITEDKDDLTGIYIEDLKNAMKEILK